MSTHSFSIENVNNASTGKPFGPKYAGSFTIRRPSLADKRMISVRDAASLSAAGELDISLVNDGIRLINYVFSFVETVAEQPTPEWFDMHTMYDTEDEEAVLAVWAEVSKFLARFRPKTGGDGSQQGSGQPSLLVQE